MAAALVRLLEKKKVAVISGGKRSLLQTQVVEPLMKWRKKHHLSKNGMSRETAEHLLYNLQLLPSSGALYYARRPISAASPRGMQHWKLLEHQRMTVDQKLRAVDAIMQVAAEQGILGETHGHRAGELIDDRDGQITFSALGQQAKIEDKLAWDPSGVKKLRMADAAQRLLPDLEVRPGGSTSIDITPYGIDKAFGMRQLCHVLGVKLDEIFYVGDKFKNGGNDSPVQEMGIECLEVKNPEETLKFLQKLKL
jgi:HAD superfamily hydrolase (TIGR01484 family)